jgi:hypothetical protein
MARASAAGGDARGEPVIGERAQRVVERAHQRPAEALRQHGIAKRLLRWAQATLGDFSSRNSTRPSAEHHQIGKAGMDAHADEDRLALRAARAGLGHLVGAVVDDGRAGQGDAQRRHHRALQIGLGSAAAPHPAQTGNRNS